MLVFAFMLPPGYYNRYVLFEPFHSIAPNFFMLKSFVHVTVQHMMYGFGDDPNVCSFCGKYRKFIVPSPPVI